MFLHVVTFFYTTLVLWVLLSSFLIEYKRVSSFKALLNAQCIHSGLPNGHALCDHKSHINSEKYLAYNPHPTSSYPIHSIPSEIGFFFQLYECYNYVCQIRFGQVRREIYIFLELFLCKSPFTVTCISNSSHLRFLKL